MSKSARHWTPLFTPGPLLACLLAAGSVARGADTDTAATSGVHEILLTGDGSAADPFDTVATLELTAPSGEKRVKPIHAFHDGGDTWRARVYLNEPGAWKWLSSCARDRGLDGKTGTLLCSRPRAEDHGFVRRDSEHPYHFVHDDGTRFFLWGQTYYGLLAGARAGDQWKTAIDGTRRYGMNKVRFYVYPRAGEGAPAPPDIRDPAYWRKLDEVVRYLGERGMIADLILASKEYAFQSVERDQAYVRYVVARYAAFPNVAICLTNEWNYTNRPREFWDDWGNLAFTADPWSVAGRAPRLLSIHHQTRWDFQFFGRGWVSHACVQVGVRNGQPAQVDELQEARAGRRVRIAEGDVWGNRSILLNRGHEIPVVNDEYGYIGEPVDASAPKRDGKFVALTRAKHRNIIWGIALAGGYGSAGDKTDHAGGRPYMAPTYWVDIPEYGDIRRLVDFFTTKGLEYWTMSPDNGLARIGERVYVLAATGRQYAVYAADGGTVGIELAAGEYTAVRYDPRTGEAVSLGTAVGGAVWKTALPAREDWVLLLRWKQP